MRFINEETWREATYKEFGPNLPVGFSLAFNSRDFLYFWHPELRVIRRYYQDKPYSAGYQEAGFRELPKKNGQSLVNFLSRAFVARRRDNTATIEEGTEA